MMKKNKKKICGVFFLILLCICGCGRDTEIMYFGSGADGDAYGRTEEERADRQAQPSAKWQETEDPGDEAEQICVHVCGQVCRPGVVMLPAGSRAWEAVEAAGGLTEEAQEAAVNLASVLQDGQKLYIPAADEDIPAADGAAADSGTVNLNTADAARLQSLPGIGASRAADIISYRESHGGFRSVEEIMQVPGIKESTYEKIRDKIAVD